MPIDDHDISQFELITGCSREEAKRWLDMFDGNFEHALHAFLENATGAPASGQTPVQTPSQTRTDSQGSSTHGVLATLLYVYSMLPLGSYVRQVLDKTFLLHQQRTDHVDPIACYTRFSASFDARYGSHHIPFQQASYVRSLETAKKDLKFFLVYLHAPQHPDADEFCRQVLCRDEVVAWVLDRECLTWAGSVLDYEAYQASFALHAEAFPFLALILYKQGKMQLVHRLQGCTDYKQVIEELDAAINEHGQDMAIARADRKEMDLARRIREEQDQAYQESLRIDREKQRQRERELEEEQRKRDLERQRELDKERRVHRKEETRKRLLETLPTEPTLEQANAQAKKLCKVAFRLPNGTRVDRKFWEEDVVEALYHFVGTHDLHIEGEEFVLCTNFPRRKIGRSNEVTLKEVGLSPAGMVVVEEVIDGASAE